MRGDGVSSWTSVMTTDEDFVRLEAVGAEAEAEEDDGAGAEADAEVDEEAAGAGAAAGAAAAIGAGKSRTREYSADTLARSLIRMLVGRKATKRTIPSKCEMDGGR
jgi:hypothetical protein